MKRLLALAMTTLMLISMLTGCGSAEPSAAADNDKVYTVAIIQLVTHDALDAATQGFQDALVAELGEGNVNFDLQNAAGDTNTCAAAHAALALNLFPKFSFCTLDLITLGVTVNLLLDGLDFLQFKVDNIIHYALCLCCMLLEQFIIEICFGCKRVDYIREEVDGDETAGVVWTQWYFAAWVCRYGLKTQVCIAVWY